MYGKQKRLPFKTCVHQATHINELIHSYVSRPMQTCTHSGARYFTTFIDDYSKMTHVYFLQLQ